MTITKSTISKYFKQLEKYGFIVKNLQNNKPMRKGARDLPDLIVIGKRFKGDLYFLEIKVGADKLSNGQREMLKQLSISSNIAIIDEHNYSFVFDNILEGKFYEKKIQRIETN